MEPRCQSTEIVQVKSYHLNFICENSLLEEYKDQIYYELLKYKYLDISLNNYTSKIFKKFFSQKKAIEYLESIQLHFGQFNFVGNKQEIRIIPVGIFAEELGFDGNRQYIVSSFEAMWYYCYSLNNSNRYLYEVIIEDQPCWLYFDIEYDRSKYIVEDQKVIYLFTKNLIEWIFKQFKNILDKDNIIYLNSTTDNKFSYHVIVKCVNRKRKFSTLFNNNLSMRVFINFFLEYLEEKEIVLDQFGDLKLHNIIDKGVYTRNRCFRMLFSSKFGRSNVLQIDREHTKFNLTEIPPIQLFRSMVTFLNIDDFSSFDFITKDIITSCYCINLDSFSIPNNGITLKTDTTENHSYKSDGKNKSYIPEHLIKISEYVILFWNKLNQELKNNKSLLHELDESEISDFCLREIKLDFCFELSKKIKNNIYSAIYITESDLLIILPTKCNKLCLNIGREHISNGIKIIINNDNHFYQKCFDPDCENFKSKMFLIPTTLSNYSHDIKELAQIINK